MRASTLQEIATRVGISAPGVLHHFGSKDGLLLAVLEERDRRDLTAAGIGEQPQADSGRFSGVEAAVERTKASPGLARLYTVMAAEATEPEHPAHDWFQRRYERIRALVRTEIEAGIAAGSIHPSVDAEALSQLVPGLTDGLQLQWLLDPELDTTAALRMAAAGLVDQVRPH